MPSVQSGTYCWRRRAAWQPGQSRCHEQHCARGCRMSCHGPQLETQGPPAPQQPPAIPSLRQYKPRSCDCCLLVWAPDSCQNSGAKQTPLAGSHAGPSRRAGRAAASTARMRARMHKCHAAARAFTAWQMAKGHCQANSQATLTQAITSAMELACTLALIPRGQRAFICISASAALHGAAHLARSMPHLQPDGEGC